MLGSQQPFTHVHQILPALHVADASGAHTLRARDALREHGFVSEIFVDQVDAPLRSEAKMFDELDGFVVPRSTALLYQLAVGSVLVERLLTREEPLLVNYHNLTPASFFAKWAPDWLDAVALGRSQLHRLVKRTSHAIAVSKFNERDLRAAGFVSTSVVPPLVDVSSSSTPSAHRPIRPAGTTWLFVGKLLPHKAAHDLVRALAAYRHAYDPQARLVLVGGHPIPSYAKAVREYSESLGLRGAVEMTGATSAERLSEAYVSADVFVCLSDHEGFCFPLLEAMNNRLPIVAFAAGAVADTLGGAGIVLRDKSGPTVASAVHRVVTDASLRERIIDAGRDRLDDFELARTKKTFVEAVGRALHRIAVDMPGSSSALERPRRSFEPPEGRSVLSSRVLASKVGATPLRTTRLGTTRLDSPEPVRAIHQLVPMLVPGDATSDHAIQLRRLARDMGLESEIFATAIHDDLRDESFLVHELPDRRLPGTLLVYQMSSGSEMVHLARERLEPLAVNYHNVTPAYAYEHWQPAIAAEQRWARRQLSFLAGRASLAICDSSYNARELEAAGYRNTVVCPVLVDMERLGAFPAGPDPASPDPASPNSAGPNSAGPNSAGPNSAGAASSHLPSEGRANWLFVGRIAPHKAQHVLVEALASYVKLYDDRVRLDLIGRPGSYRYAKAVRHLAHELGVSEQVKMESDLDDVSLGEYYRRAAVFVSASVHEGFCVPIVEAMHHQVPVVALAAAAVPETVGSAGLLVESSDPALLAATVHSVLDEKGLHALLARRGRERASQLSLANSRAIMREVLERWIGGHELHELHELEEVQSL